MASRGKTHNAAKSTQSRRLLAHAHARAHLRTKQAFRCSHSHWEQHAAPGCGAHL